MIHDLVIQLFRIKKILWSYDFDLADSYDLMICMTGFFVIPYKKTRDPMIPTWTKIRDPVISKWALLMIPWSQEEENLWSCDLEIWKTRDPMISKCSNLMILWSQNQEKNDRMIWGLIILWSHYLWDCNICDPRNFSYCWTIFAAVEKKYSALGNLNSRPIRNTKVRAEAVG